MREVLAGQVGITYVNNKHFMFIYLLMHIIKTQGSTGILFNEHIRLYNHQTEVLLRGTFDAVKGPSFLINPGLSGFRFKIFMLNEAGAAGTILTVSEFGGGPEQAIQVPGLSSGERNNILHTYSSKLYISDKIRILTGLIK